MKITYFGTDGCEGHKPMGINYNLTEEEYEYFCSVDSRWFFEEMAKHRNEEHKCRYWIGKGITVYCIPYSVDDNRGNSHTDLFIEGEHSIEYMESVILRNPFLRKQFDINNRFK